MTFIVSLAHFCEVHGPSMIMCTQVVNNPENLNDFYSPELPESQFCQSCMFQIPNKEDTTDIEDTSSSCTVNDSTDTSVNSRLIFNNNINSSSLTLEDQITTLLNSQTISEQKQQPKHTKIMTLRTKSKEYPDTYFISTQFPTNTEVYSSLRQIIVRVFTTETITESNKPITFGNSKHGYSIALTFSLVDKTARGSERKYSIIVTSNWEIDLFNNYTFILTNLNQLIRNIHKVAKEKQQKNTTPLPSSTTTTTSSSSPCDLNSDFSNNDIYLRRSAGLPKAKSMVEILNDDNFFVKIHVWASYMLNALENHKHV